METVELKHGAVRIFGDAGELTEHLAGRFIEIAQAACRGNGRFTVALSGGSTPRRLYSLLAEPRFREQVPWDRTHLFWGDERCVPHDHPDSNFNMVREELLTRAPIPQANVHAMRDPDADPLKAASEYDQELKRFFDVPEGVAPHFDLVLLGLGPDGHTASLFPDTKALGEKQRLVVANYVDKFKTHRLTFTLPVLNSARHVIFMVSGAEKEEILPAVLLGERCRYPAQLVNPDDGTLEWYIDRQAAALLDRKQLAAV